jgi:hypothetical protein
MADGGSVTVWMKLASDAEFTKISVSSAGTDGAYYFGNYEYSDDIGANGGALALKVGAAINGFVDNIMLWTGHGDVPLDTTVTYIPSAVVEHR